MANWPVLEPRKKLNCQKLKLIKARWLLANITADSATISFTEPYISL
jgi:hypothetical protein